MLWWCTLLFLTGLWAFLDTIFDYGEILRRVNSVVIMMTSLGLLVRVVLKTSMRDTENRIEKIDRLEKEISEVKNSPDNQAEGQKPRATNVR